MRVLIMGGSKSGKSHIAEELVDRLSSGGKKIYWATMTPVDEEDDKRIAAHIAERNVLNFETVECAKRVSDHPCDDCASVLFDSVTALLANEMFTDAVDHDAPFRAAKDLIKLGNSVKNFVCVCDDIFRDGEEYDDLTEEYRMGLAYICNTLVGEFDAVIEAVSGIPIVRKGEKHEVIL